LSLLDRSDYLDRAKQAMTWYAKAMQLDPFDAYAPVACGKCLDRIGGSPEESTRYFVKALQNDPHNTYIAMELGRHCLSWANLRQPGDGCGMGASNGLRNRPMWMSERFNNWIASWLTLFTPSLRT